MPISSCVTGAPKRETPRSGDRSTTGQAVLLHAVTAIGSSPLRDRRSAAITVAVILAVVLIAALAPVPSPLQLRDWAHSLGLWFPVAFLLAHTVVTVFPFPRTAFTLAAGLLFGAWVGVALAVVSSTLSAVAAAVLVRTFGRQLRTRLRHPRIRSLDARLRDRGWLAVLSLRLIPAIPFSVINYAAGASSVRLVPYLVATVIGLTPGTAAVVVLGDALTGQISPLLFATSAGLALIGLGLGVYEVRAAASAHRPVFASPS